MRIFDQGNEFRSNALADPRRPSVDLEALVHGGLQNASSQHGSVASSTLAARGDTVGVSAADGDGYAVSLIQSVYHAFGSGLIDPDTGILFHIRGTNCPLAGDSPNVFGPRKRPAHTLMPSGTGCCNMCCRPWAVKANHKSSLSCSCGWRRGRAPSRR